MSKIVLLSNVPLGSTFRLGSHHLSRELSRLGHEVVHVSTPISTLEARLGREVKSRRGLSGSIPLSDSHRAVAERAYADEDGVLHDVARPALPVRWNRESRAVRSLLAEGPAAGADIVLIDQLLMSPALERFGGKVIYRSTDVQSSPLGLSLEQQVLARADGVVWCSSFSATEFGTSVDKPQLVLENGVDETFFGTSTDRRDESFVYVGAIDKRFDWNLITSLGRAFPDAPIRLAGPVAVAPNEPLPASVELLGSIPYENVPELLRSATIGLLPLNNDPMNAGRSPMKFFEYLAAGLKILATATPELVGRGDVPGVGLYSNVEDGLRIAKRLLAAPVGNDAGSEYAQQFAWKSRVATLDTFLSSVQES